jgi:signal transduction histidine kinase
VQDWHHLTADQVTQDVRCLTAQIAAADARPVYLALRESARTGQPFLWEGRFKTPGGQRWMRWEGQPDPQPDGSTLWSGIAIDITPQKETEIALQLAQKAVHDQQHLEALLQQEQRLSTLQNRLLRTISHEFRTPLTIIQNAADLIERYTYRLSMEDRHRKLEIIRGQIRHLSGLLDEMMDSVRLTFQHSDFQPAPMNLEQLCRASVNEIAGTIGAGHHLVLESSGDTGAVALDERLISRILLNLLSNAVKYSPAGSTIRLWLEARPAEVVLRVSDEGIGMSTDDQAHLFEPFYRSPVVAGIPGTGLGLNIVQECVLRHNGRIEVHSVPQQGTTFIIHLPVGQPARA